MTVSSTPDRPECRAGSAYRSLERHRYRMVVSDIDGTLLNSNAELSDNLRRTVAEARHAGIIFTVATGRRYTTTERVLRDLNLLDRIAPASPRHESLSMAVPSIVLQTGAVVVSGDGEHVLFRDPVPRADAAMAVKILIEAGLQPIIYENRVLDQRLFTGPAEYDSEAASHYLRNNPHLVERRPYDELEIEGDPLQIAVIDRADRLAEPMGKLKLAHCRTLLSYSSTLDNCFMEVFHEGCTKARAVERLANYLGFAMEDTVCIGDNWNDVEMLGAAGCGIAVANAEPGVLPTARRTTVSNDEDAVAVVLRQLLNGEEPGLPNPVFRVADECGASGAAHSS